MDDFQPEKDNALYEALIWTGKAIIAFVLLYSTYKMFLVKTKGEMYFGIFLLIFITLPTVFVVWLRKGFLSRHPGFAKPWKILRIIYAIIMVLFVLFMIAAAWRAYDKDKTQKAIDFINSEKITLDDVMGKNLPPVPDQKINDSTIVGIDANNNGIRDDVELAIFKKYPNSAKIRAAELQYAQALQLMLTRIFNSVTLGQVGRKLAYSYMCIGEFNPDVISNKTLTDNMIGEIEKTIINTDIREKARPDINKIVGDNPLTKNIEYSTPPDRTEPCDINLSSLPN